MEGWKGSRGAGGGKVVKVWRGNVEDGWVPGGDRGLGLV